MIVDTIFSNLVYNSTYFVQTWPHLKREYFEDTAQVLFDLMDNHIKEYNTIPSVAAIGIALDKKSLSDAVYSDTKEMISSLVNAPEDIDWLMKETEEYCKDKAMYKALSRAIEIKSNADKPENERDKRIPDVGVIPELMQTALSVSFDSSVGHDYFEDFEKRWLLYQSKAMKIPFSSNILNVITKGGAERGTLNVLLAGVNVGKSLGLCSLAADYVKDGYNVLYISMEMAEHVCSKRIDANLLDVTLDDIDNQVIQYVDYKNRMNRLKNTKVGRLIVKQYPTSGAGVNHFRSLVAELKLKKAFKPDVIIVDYLGICMSTRIRSSENTYILVKAIAEEVRGLAVETNTVIWTGAQTSKGAWDASDMNMSDVAESAGLPATADFMLGVIETDELAQQGIQLFKQIKSRYGDKNFFNHFKMEVKKGNQRWVDTDNSDIGFKADYKGVKIATNLEDAQSAMTKQANDNRREKLVNMAKEHDIVF